mgnify:CR=1 FL=1
MQITEKTAENFLIFLGITYILIRIIARPGKFFSEVLVVLGLFFLCIGIYHKNHHDINRFVKNKKIYNKKKFDILFDVFLISGTIVSLVTLNKQDFLIFVLTGIYFIYTLFGYNIIDLILKK